MKLNRAKILISNKVELAAAKMEPGDDRSLMAYQGAERFSTGSPPYIGYYQVSEDWYLYEPALIDYDPQVTVICDKTGVDVIGIDGFFHIDIRDDLPECLRFISRLREPINPAELKSAGMKGHNFVGTGQRQLT